jgi:hypothetical protein
MLRTLLATLVAVSLTAAAQQSRDDGAQPPASQPASEPAVRSAPRNPTQARILEELLRGTEPRQAKPILPVTPGGSSAPGAETPNGNASLLLEGTVLIERAGRLVRLGDRVEFHFKGGSPAENAADAMEFNKNGLLEAMEAEAAAGVEEFIISAEVTRYRGANYLLLRKYRRQIAHGNLSP